ncbi:MAG: DUF3793 family protein [Eubacterium sp.]|nr:DUF3793 family protein [Eubacterium sp.]
MSEQVIDIAVKMGREEVEKQLAYQCAALITGQKVSNTFITSRSNIVRLAAVFKGTSIACRILCVKGNKATFLLYRRGALEKYLKRSDIACHLKEYGYENMGFGEMLRRLSQRYAAYICRGEEFPHELGLFLGYPSEDVAGFVSSKGRDYKLSGYWKVYGDADHCKKLFASFDLAREQLIKLVAGGAQMRWITMAYEPA